MILLSPRRPFVDLFAALAVFVRRSGFS